MPDHVVRENALSTANFSTSFPLWVQIVVIVGAVLLSAGAFISLLHPILLVSPHDEINSAVRVYAAYTFSRDLGLAFMLIAALLCAPAQLSAA